MTYNLFALTESPSSRIVRFSLSAEVQAELTNYFVLQERGFINSIEEEIIFDGKYKPDMNEVLVISDYDDIDMLESAIRSPLSVPEIVPSPSEFDGIRALFTGYISNQDEVTVLIQYFDKRKIISTNGLSIFHSENVYRKIEGIGVTIDSKLSAILKSGSLKFFSFHLLRQIFDLSGYYKEATDADINDFSALPIIKVEDLQQFIKVADSWVRRKLSLIQQSQILDTVPINDIKAVALDFNIPLQTLHEGGVELIKLPIHNKAELKTILRFLDEDYYKSPLSKTQFLSNSKRMA